ncbi:4-(cytidine 5'-diphospho)-2-C-methyl-D-erythritol kinase [Inhella gelatinilytica]|uniref:4-diphosphocytidyl-2-C-methyl-D-erythritol kinase n=1 Tax=Inhella gelatinilytica TaxID=2795030 RepID=A0A931ITN8_9BURK|nr:4-(cytidine 5'-diphospho)-2-C-methyl-D-erythritol kinase [Inhella gelatinilytica]MBH9551321.1 4-(cytidine 5'-diphospho)-2-C-methyl-D-erythritol kinase [Inhella gelatinilytica]
MHALYDLPAPAKLNLYLHVVGKRPDGYHLLESLFVPIDWGDSLHLVRRTDGRIVRHDLHPATAEPLPADDLCTRAARLLQKASGSTAGVDIHLHKRLPSGAGLGGGSSDAATVLIGLNRLWNLHLSRAQLMALGLQLGADLPFFLGTGPAFAQGIGENLRAVAFPATRFAVIKPRQSLPTRAIFSSPLLQTSKSQAIVAGSFADNIVLDWKAKRNDLQASASAQCAEIDDALQCLFSRFGNSRMTGSGSAVFAEVGSDDSPMATELVDFGIGMHHQWEGRVCRSLESLPLAPWLKD